MRIGIDVGGTNTDAAVIDGQVVVASAKRPTTADVLGGVAAALDAVTRQLTRRDIEVVAIGTTQFMNAVVERDRLAPVVAVRLATPPQTLPPMVDWPDRLRSAVRAGVHVCAGGHQYTGEPMQPLDTDAVRAVARDAAGDGITEFAVSSVFSPVNPSAELDAAEIIRAEHPGASVTLSHEIGRIGILERENATILNAALRPLAQRVLDGLADVLAGVGIEAPLYLSQNDSTVMGIAAARAFPILTISSGPTNSMRGASVVAGVDDTCVVVDVGGTTTDVGLLLGGLPRESATAVDLGGVRSTFRIPDVVSVGIGGGSVVRDGPDGPTVGPDSVGHRLTEQALVFGGDTITLTDVAVAAGVAEIGDPTRVAHLDRSWTAEVLHHVGDRIAEAIDHARLNADEIPVVAVGGGAFLVPSRLDGVGRVVRPEHAAVANAVGAAAAKVGGEVDRVYSLADRGRAEVIAEARTDAVSAAIEAGADPESVQVVDVDDTPLGYLEDGTACRVRVRAVGDLATTRPSISEELTDVAR